MDRKKIAVLFGGCSTEYTVSLHSAYSVLTNLNAEKYEIIPIGITRTGEWYRYYGAYDKLMDDTWADTQAELVAVAVSPSRSVHGIVELGRTGAAATRIDYAFPVLHGKNGEDGTVQGMFELAGIPVIGCGTLSSALCMDKDRAHKLAALAGVAAPKAVTIQQYERENAREMTANLTYPLFVK